MIFYGGGGDNRTFLYLWLPQKRSFGGYCFGDESKEVMEISDSDDDCVITGGKFIVFVSYSVPVLFSERTSFYRDNLLRLVTYNTIQLRELFVYSNEVLKLYFSWKVVFIRISQQFYLLSFRKK